MLLYLLHRLLLAIPTLLVVSWATFALSYCSGGDPVPYDYDDQPQAYLARARQLKLDKPLFYISLQSWALPDTLHRILPLSVREHLAALTQRSGNWAAVDAYWKTANATDVALRSYLSGSTLSALNAIRFAKAPEQAQPWLDTLRAGIGALEAPQRTEAARRLAALEQALRHWSEKSQRWKTLLPQLCWHGTDNRYHHWLAGFISGNAGTSVVTGNPLLTELRPRLYATLLVNGTALALAYALGVPLGVFMARYQRHWADGGIRLGLLFVYAMPVMWLGSVLMLLLAHPDVGLGWLRGGSAEPWLLSGKPFWRWAASNAEHFLLPIFTLALHHCTVIALQMRAGLVEALQRDHIRTARAKGLSERVVFWRHAFRDGLFPLITTFGYLFPALFSGSLVIEYLFDFPGMGVKMQNAFAQHDYPVLFAMVMFLAALTLLGMLIADALYAWADPRVRFGRQR